MSEKTFTDGVADVLPNQQDAYRLAETVILHMSPKDIFDLYHRHLDQNEYIQMMYDTEWSPSDNIFKMVKFCITILILNVNTYEGGEGATLDDVMDDIETYHSRMVADFADRGVEWDLWG